MKLYPLCFILISLIFCFAYAEENQTKVKIDKVSSEAKSKVEHSMMKRFGGRIRQPGSEKGRVVIVNKQNIVGEEVVNAVVEEWSKKYRVTIQTSNEDVESGKGNVVIRLEDTERVEPIVVAPENFWATVNVRSLGKDNPPKAILNSRLEKELKRAYAFVNGGTCGNEPGGLCGTVTTLTDLDIIKAKLYTPDVEVRILNNQPTIGIVPYRVVKYIDACREGWAPQPTNDYQKAVWDEVHKLPTEPIKINPETNKVKE